MTGGHILILKITPTLLVFHWFLQSISTQPMSSCRALLDSLSLAPPRGLVLSGMSSVRSGRLSVPFGSSPCRGRNVLGSESCEIGQSLLMAVLLLTSEIIVDGTPDAVDDDAAVAVVVLDEG